MYWCMHAHQLLSTEGNSVKISAGHGGKQATRTRTTSGSPNGKRHDCLHIHCTCVCTCICIYCWYTRAYHFLSAEGSPVMTTAGQRGKQATRTRTTLESPSGKFYDCPMYIHVQYQSKKYLQYGSVVALCRCGSSTLLVRLRYALWSGSVKSGLLCMCSHCEMGICAHVCA